MSGLKSLNATLDGVVSKILGTSEFSVTASIKVPLLPEQRAYFERHLREGNVITSLNSAKACVGLEQELLTKRSTASAAGTAASPFDLQGDSIVYVARFTSFMPEWLPQGISLGYLFAEGMPVGKLYVKNPDLRLEGGAASDLLGRPDFNFSHNGLQPAVQGSTVLLPLSSVTQKRPDPKMVTKEFLQAVMWKEITRQQVLEVMEPHGTGFVTISPYSGFVGAVYLATAGHEMVITDELHGDSRVAECDTNWEFHIELKSAASPSSVRPEYLKVEFYLPKAVTP